MTPHDDLPTPKRRGRRRLLAVAIAGAVVLAACGSDDAAPGASEVPTTDAPSTGSEPPADVIESSTSLDVVGEPLIELSDDVDPAIGTTAPEITGQQFDGTAITIGGSNDGPTMLVFLAHWCPHCNDEIPEILQLRDAGELPEDLNIVGISTAADPAGANYPPSQWVVDKGWDFPTLADTSSSEAFQIYGGNGFPFTALLDDSGAVLARKSGSAPADEIKAWVDEGLAQA